MTDSPVLSLTDRITVLPVVHGSGDFAVEVRRLMLSHSFDCLAVPLPESFRIETEEAVEWLPNISIVLQREPETSFPSACELDTGAPGSRASYVPIDPCQPVIAALRIAMQEHIPRVYIDIEDEHYLPVSAILPDPYAVKQVSADRFGAAVLPAINRPEDETHQQRIAWMASELQRLETRFERILCVCSIIDWPWIREAYQKKVQRPECPPDPDHPARIFSVSRKHSIFALGELPFITGCYERARAQLDDDENLSVDGIKALLLAARDRYKEELGQRARPITPQLLSVMLRYIRNLSLIERRLTPDLFNLVTAAKQIAGDQYAIHLVEAAREYPYHRPDEYPEIEFGIDQAILPDETPLTIVNRLPGHPMVWRSLRLNTRPEIEQREQWQKSWDPYGQCSWPPEDVKIERFRTHVQQAALDLLGNDLARTEKFSASMKDGLDIRETLRNWHTGDLYVKEFPPSRGQLDCVVMLFDSPADPREYPWRITWHAEHQDESTLSFFGTDFSQKIIGPGIAVARYGGCMFLFPPRPVPDIFRDPRFNFTDTLEERLLAAAMFHSRERHIALLSHAPPGAGWRRLARRYNRKLIHVPLGRFGSSTIDQLRMFHVLNGQHIRSFAADFIRKP